MYKYNRLLVAAGMIATLAACGDDSDPSAPPPGSQEAVLTGNITTSRTLYSDTVYTLKGYVKVTNGATLAIQPGTKIVGDTLTPGSSLWITRGAKINANGSAAQPIVFTSARSPGNRRPGDWGGIIIIGNAPVNRNVATLYTEGPDAARENYAGGTDENDNSGVLRYVRIEFAGYDVSGGQGQELNSLSMYAVGRGTTIEYVQTVSGLDDSFEWFGGTVDARYLISYESGDDHFDWTEGYRGRVQHLIAFQTKVIQPRPNTGNVSSDPRGFEGDGCEPGLPGCVTGSESPQTQPVFANFTLIGPGAGGYGTITDGNGAVIRRGTGGIFLNGVIARWPGVGVSVRDTATNNRITEDKLMMRNTFIADMSTGFEPTNVDNERFGMNLNPAGSGNAFQAGTTAASLFASLSPISLDWTPSGAITTGGLTTLPSAIASRLTGYFGGTLQGTAYRGAAAPAGPKWWEGWTAYADQ